MVKVKKTPEQRAHNRKRNRLKAAKKDLGPSHLEVETGRLQRHERKIQRAKENIKERGIQNKKRIEVIEDYKKGGPERQKKKHELYLRWKENKTKELIQRFKAKNPKYIKKLPPNAEITYNWKTKRFGVVAKITKQDINKTKEEEKIT